MRRELTFLLCSAAAMGQTIVEGVVVSKTTGQPLAGIRVSTAVSDAAGHFYLNTMPPGPATAGLRIDGPGVLPRQQAVAIGAQDSHVTVRIALTPQSVITGKVVDENGWPIRAGVTAAQPDSQGQMVRVRSAEADDQGAYRIGKLPAGKYSLLIRPLESAPWGDYLPVWYGPVELKEGQEASDTDVHLRAGGGVELRGKATVPQGFRPEQAYVMAEWLEFGNTWGSRRVLVGTDGSFVLHHATAGQYRLTGSMGTIPNDVAPQYLAVAAVEVGKEEVTGISLNIGPAVLRDLKGTIVGGGAIDPGTVRIQLQRVPSGNVQLRAKVAADGTFVIPGVWPDRYVASASAEEGVAVSFRWGEREVLMREFLFDGTNAPLRVTLEGRSEPARVTGKVTDRAMQPVWGASVVLEPQGAAYEPAQRRWIARAGTDQNGEFSGFAMLPGVYRVYVVREPAAVDESMADPGFRSAQEKMFPPVTLQTGVNPPITLTMTADQ